MSEKLPEGEISKHLPRQLLKHLFPFNPFALIPLTSPLKPCFSCPVLSPESTYQVWFSLAQWARAFLRLLPFGALLVPDTLSTGIPYSWPLVLNRSPTYLSPSPGEPGPCNMGKPSSLYLELLCTTYKNVFKCLLTKRGDKIPSLVTGCQSWKSP